MTPALMIVFFPLVVSSVSTPSHLYTVLVCLSDSLSAILLHVGLFGSPNNNPSDELRAPDGSVIDVNTASQQDIHNFGLLCE